MEQKKLYFVLGIITKDILLHGPLIDFIVGFLKRAKISIKIIRELCIDVGIDQWIKLRI
jgi:hypothetical protein